MRELRLDWATYNPVSLAWAGLDLIMASAEIEGGAVPLADRAIVMSPRPGRPPEPLPIMAFRSRDRDAAGLSAAWRCVVQALDETATRGAAPQQDLAAGFVR